MIRTTQAGGIHRRRRVLAQRSGSRHSVGMLSRRTKIARLRAVALAALPSYALPDGRLTFVTHGENTTFRHESAAGRHLVRVHRPQRHGQRVDAAAAIWSLAMLDACERR